VKIRYILIATLALAPTTLEAQDVQVRIYTARPPTEVNISATEGKLHWKSCLSCPEKSGQSLTVESENSEVKVGGQESSKELFVSGTYRLRPSSGPEFSGAFPLRIESRDNGLLVVASLPLETYVEKVLAAESGDFQQIESMKAMAIVARTYAIRFRGQHKDKGFDFCNTTHCQALRWDGASPRVLSAIEATRGVILRFGGTPAQTFYHQNCGGEIAAASDVWPAISEPYLPGHTDPYCLAANPLKWENVISVADIDRALKLAGLAPPQGWNAIEVVSRTASGRAQRLKLAGGTSPGVVMSASSFRFAVDRALGWNQIRSDLYQVGNSSGRVVFSGRGSGHGVGLCQAGAEEMAREGKTYSQILSFYFPGTELGPAQMETWQKWTTERFELVSTEPESDSKILPAAERILKENESNIGWQLPFRVRLQIFPTLELYRNTTGQPGWVAASTRRHTIRLEPLVELQRREAVDSTLRHEFYHLLVETHSKAQTPLWFREGLVLYLSGPESGGVTAPRMTDEQMEIALQQPQDRDAAGRVYSAARQRVATLVQENGRQAVLEWLVGGIPRNITMSAAEPPAKVPHN
jgi:stage II sporulation protein D